MDSLQLQTILRILPTALENANYEILKQIQDEIDKAKLRIFDPPYLEYFHEKFDIELYKDSDSIYNKFKELQLDETRRVKDPRILKEKDCICVVTPYLFSNVEKICIYIGQFATQSRYEGITEDNVYEFCLNAFSSNHNYENIENGYSLIFKIDSDKMKNFTENNDDATKGRLYIYK